MKNPCANPPAVPGVSRAVVGHNARALGRGRAVSGGRYFNRQPAGGWAAAFTITEILIVIAIILLVAGFGAADMVKIANSVQNRSPSEILKDAMREARFLAQTRMLETALYYRSDTGSIVICDDKGTVIEEFPIPDAGKDGGTKYSLTFIPVMPVTDMDSDFPSTPTLSTKAVYKRLIFHPSGATVPAQVVFDDGKSKDTFMLDPFSSGPAPKPLNH